MFVLGSDISIGKFIHVKPHEVKITKSIFEYVDKAVIKLPISSRIVRAGEIITQTTDTANEFKEGDKAKITIRSLLTMSSGTNWDVSYGSPFSTTTEAYYFPL